MKIMRFRGVKRLRGEPAIPGDKSISHRAAILGAVSSGDTFARNFLDSLDTRSTLGALSELGVEWHMREDGLLVQGRGYDSMKEPERVIDVGNSGTTIRLMSGVLASCRLFSVMTGDPSIRRRPMRRIADPLRLMGATIDGRNNGEFAPLAIRGGGLHGIDYAMPVPSAQVKSAIILAAMNAEGETVIRGDSGSRDHTERMAMGMGADLRLEQGAIVVRHSTLQGGDVDVPGDISSAAFFLAAAAMLPGSEILIRNVGLNPTRAGFLGVLNSMGAMIMEDSYEVIGVEPRGNLLARGSFLSGVEIEGWRVPSMIDELPLLAVVATQAEGVTRVSGADELRIKESDRIKAMVIELRKMGARIEETEDGFEVAGRCRLRGAAVDSHGDHRIAMSLAVAALCAEGETAIGGWECVSISFPGFDEVLAGLSG